MKTYETINDILVHLFNEIWELEKNAIITEEFKDTILKYRICLHSGVRKQHQRLL